ncbi:hypothetical protein JXR01_02105 [Candidatus Kaiserbacteria bacterium]|nr:MAG: hypothetical protein JXR01_02105 [Candidatus Kaiserbacteria bacterium]
MPTYVGAYSLETHADITAATLNAHASINGEELFSNSEVAEIVDGSLKEDSSTRYLNHFYDPVKNRGLRGRFSDFAPVNGDASMIWAQDTIMQGNFGRGKIKSDEILFSSETDFSWARGVYEYVHGDKNYALQVLGHQLHLVQDATVPAHTRNDAHPPWDFGGDLYEQYSESRKVIVEITDEDVPVVASIKDAILYAATFSNYNFVSRDASFGKYTHPSESDVYFDSGFAIHKIYGHRVVNAKQDYEESTEEIETEYFFNDKDGKISKDYWDVLSKQAVLHGVAVIDLFFKEVEEERKTGALLAMNKSYKETEDVMKRLAFGRDSKLALTSLAAADVYELNKDDLDGYYAAAKVYGIHTPAAARDSALKEDAQPASALLGLQQALKKTIVGEPLPDGVTPQKQTGPTLEELQARVNEASALIAFLEALLAQREKECIENSLQGPWNKVGWVGDQPGCNDPTPWIQKMFFAPIQGTGGSGTAAISGSISADPSSGFFGPTTVSWNTSGATSCTVTGGLISWTGTSGSEFALIAEDMTLTLSCDSGAFVKTVSLDVDVPFEF